MTTDAGPRGLQTAALLESIIEASPAFIHVLSGPSFIFEFANEAYYRLVGRRDLIGRPAFEAMPEAAAGGYQDRIAEVMATQQPFYGWELPVQLARTPGAPVEQRLIDLVYIPLVDADGTCRRVLGHGTDVTDNVLARRGAQDAERHAQQRLQSSLSAARMAAWEWDLQTDVVRGSPLLNDLFGLASGTATFDGEFGRGLLHAEDREAHVSMVSQALAQGGRWHTEYRALRPDGETIWCEEVAEISRDEATGARIAVGLVWDITSRKEAERVLREADSRKSEFLATLAHELRNPLAPIRTGLQLIQRLPNGDPRVPATLAVMERQTDHLVRLVDDLMEVNRISRGKVELRRTTLPLRSALATAVEAIATTLQARQIRLVQETLDDVVVDGDRDRLVQIFSNLLSNAAKFTPAGGSVWISVRRDGAQAVAEVRDDGCGIDAAQLASVFEMFSQGPSHHFAGGMGIGLALVRQLVELHGGRVEARSGGRGTGSRFTVRLPAVAAQPPGPSAPQIAHRPQPGPRGERVLIVDDNRDAADSLAIALELEGYQVGVVYDGPSALAYCARSAPDVVLLDLGMPDMDGYAVGGRLRQLDTARRLRIFALTGFGSQADKARVLQHGFDGHLTKPVAPETLLGLLAASRGT